MSPKRVTSFPKLHLPSPQTMVSTAASAAATVVFLRSLARNYLPPELNDYLNTHLRLKLRLFLSKISNETTLLIHEYYGFNKNHLFSAAVLYVAAAAAPSATTYHASLPARQKEIDVSFSGNEEILDNFGGIQLRWKLITTELKNSGGYFYSSAVSEKKHFQLSFDKEHKSKVVDEYLPYVLERSETLKLEKKTLKLYSFKSENCRWQSVNFDHPSKFETLAMDDEMKRMIVDDLDRFLKRKELYRRVGKAWKRGYLLFGPPGTGKSSLIAAMANYLKFDVYDLELSSVSYNDQLKHLLLSTANRSILVVEDIDASIDLALIERKKAEKKNETVKATEPSSTDRKKSSSQITLSGVLNCIDGLWSSMGDERIIVFTTNHKEKLDSALLRPGRMDLHVHMSYCTPCGFRLLANNYLGTTNHPLVLKAEELIGSAKVTPAEIGEQLLKSDDPGQFLEGKRSDNESLKLKEVSHDEDDDEDDGDDDDEDDDDGLIKLVKLAKALPSKTRREILGTAEAADAVKILTQLLKKKVARVNAKSLDGKDGIKKNK